MGFISSLFVFVQQNWQGLVASVLGVVAAASFLIKALEKGTAILVKFFPSLKKADGELLYAAAWLDALCKSSFLNTLALTPDHAKPSPIQSGGGAAKALVAIALAAALLAPGKARADVTYQLGPTFPMVLVDLGANPNPVQVLAGAGLQVSFSDTRLEGQFFGRTYDMFDLALMAFGTRVTSNSGQEFGELSGALGLCTLSSLVCLSVGKHLLDGGGGILPAGQGYFVGGHLSINFGLLPTKSAEGAAVLRGNTIYFGAW